MDENKQKALQLAIGQIEKDHGKGALMKLVSVTACSLSTDLYNII